MSPTLDYVLMDILFITSSRIGDAVLSTGLLDHIARTYPQAKVTIACGPLCVSLFEGYPNLKKIIPLQKQKHHKHWIGLWKKVVGTKWDMVIDLRDSVVSRVIRTKKRFIHSRHIDKGLHKVEQNAAVMNLNPPPAPKLWFTENQITRARAIIPSEKNILAIGPTANWVGKTWPHDRFVEVIEFITDKGGFMPDAPVAVFAAPGEEDDAYKVLNSIPEDRQIDVIAKTDPGTAAAMLSLCDFYLGNDSGLMHCAAASNIPTIGVYGPSYPHLYRPWGSHTAYARTPESFDELINFEGYSPGKLKHSLMTSLSTRTVIELIKDFTAKSGYGTHASDKYP